jgi:hypothetical protein
MHIDEQIGRILQRLEQADRMLQEFPLPPRDLVVVAAH